MRSEGVHGLIVSWPAWPGFALRSCACLLACVVQMKFKLLAELDRRARWPTTAAVFFFGQRCMSIAVFMRAQVQMRTTARVHWSVHWMLRILPFVRSRSFKKTLHLGTNTYNFLCHPFLKSPSNTLLYFVIEGILKKSRQLKKINTQMMCAPMN